MYWLGRYLDPMSLTYILLSSDFDTFFVLTFNISSTIRPTTIKPCKMLLLNVLTRQIPWAGDPDLYFGCSDFDIIYINIPDLLKCKISSTKPCIVLLLNVLTLQVSWPGDLDLYFALQCLLHIFSSTFSISSTIRATTTKPCIVLLNVWTQQVPWLYDLDLYFALHWLLHLLRHPFICPQL